MKKRFLAIALVIATVMTLAIPAFAAGETTTNKREGAKTAVVYQTAGTPTDADWEKAPAVAIDKLHKGPSWNDSLDGMAGEKYASPASMKLLWDATAGKIYIKVTCNNPARGLNECGGTEPNWQKDTIYLWWNFENTTTPTEAQAKGDNTFLTASGQNNVFTETKDREITLPATVVAGQYIAFDIQQNDNPGSNAGRRVAYTWASSTAASDSASRNWAEAGQLYLSTSNVNDTNRDDGSASQGGNPSTSDFTIVAIATVGVLAAAAVVVTKRRR